MTNRIGKLGFSIIEDVIRVDADKYNELKKFTTPNLSDAMNRFRTMFSSIRPIHEECRFIGPAITVRVRPGDNLMVHKAIDIAKPGDVIVVTTGDCSTNAVWGELMTRAAMKKGIVGAVIEGGARDIDENRELGFPIFAKYIVASACDKDGPGEINEPISCGGVAVCPGDIIVGDENGIVVIPPEIIDDVIKNAENKVSYESRRIKDIDNGVIISGDIDDILRKKGVLNN
jgi:regulator of RNase E activity RraA